MELKSEIRVTEAAANHLIKVSQGMAGLKLSIRGGKGCGGNEYDLKPVAMEDIDPQDDYVVLNTETKLFISPMDLLKLLGTSIDFISDDLGNKRIDVSNPNETGRCGCGKSVTF